MGCHCLVQYQASSHKSRLQSCPSQVNPCRPDFRPIRKLGWHLWTNVPGPLENKASPQRPSHFICPSVRPATRGRSRGLGLLQSQLSCTGPWLKAHSFRIWLRHFLLDSSATPAHVDPGSLLAYANAGFSPTA